MDIKRDPSFNDSFYSFSRQRTADNNVDYLNWGEEKRYYSHNYSLEEIYNILDSGSQSALTALSRSFYARDNIYRRIIIYYASLLNYDGILVPHISTNTNLSESAIKKKYIQVLDYIENLSIKTTFARISLKVLINGAYYGIVLEKSRDKFIIKDLPINYCSSKFKDFLGRDIIDFNLTYFDSFIDEQVRKDVLAAFPKEFREAYRLYKLGKRLPIFRIPPEIAVYFSFDDNAFPMFLPILPDILERKEVIDGEIEKQKEEIKKIIVQKIPHLNEGQLLFEPPEAKVMHDGAADMLSGNPNVSVLTTYADVDAIVSKTAADTMSNIIDKVKETIYTDAGVSSELFAPTGALAIELSIKNDIAFMMVLGNKYSQFLSDLFNFLFGNQNISYKYSILPLSIYNTKDYIEQALKLAQNGYSFLLPSIACGISQRDLMSLKDLENNVLKLTELLIPLSNSYTQSGEPGRPPKDLEEKAPHTIENEESIDRQQGGSTS